MATTAATPTAISAAAELLLRSDVKYFSRFILGMPYASLTGHLYPHPRYKAFLLRKRSGSYRVINEPYLAIKELQLKVLGFLERRAGRIKPCVHGFVADRSIVTNAKRHLDTKAYHLLNLDLADFFPSITFFRVRGVFRKAPFNFSHEVATVLAQLCTHNGTLPQGAPTSPLLSNLVCRGLDRDLMALAGRHRATYTRYADDITFSFSVRQATSLPASICTFDSGITTLGKELISIIEGTHHFRVNTAKTRMSTRSHRMEVTGITINEFPNVKRKFIDRIRGALSAWKRYGYGPAQATWEAQVKGGAVKPPDERMWRRQTRGGGVPELKNVLWGRLLYVRMVRGTDDPIYTRLADKYNALCDAEKTLDPGFLASSLPVEEVVRDAVDAERATFVVDWMADYLPPGETVSEVIHMQGTAFAFEDAGRLITCDHVLNWYGEYRGLDATISCNAPGVTGLALSAVNPTTGAKLELAIAYRDAGRDVAELRVVGGTPMTHRFFAGRDTPINRHEPGTLIGYPNWSAGRPASQAPALVQTLYLRDTLKRFEISIMIRAGNSGGPFVDSSFRVAGVAQQGASQNMGNNECLCISELSSWLKSHAPPILTTPPVAPVIAGGAGVGSVVSGTHTPASGVLPPTP